ncbi:MAG: DMT family transporter [Clostridium sp.]
MGNKIKVMDNKFKGIFFMIIFALSLSIMSTFLKLAGHIPVAEKTVYRNGIAAIFAFIVIFKNNKFSNFGSYFGTRENILGLSLRSIFGIVGITLNLYALQYLMLPNATILQDLSIFFVLIFSFLFLGEKFKLRHLLLIIVAFVGAFLIVDPTSGKFLLLPSIAAILGAMMNGGDSVTMRYLRDKCEPITLIFFYNFISCVILLPFMIIYYKHLSLHTTIYLILAGLMYIIVEFSIILAYKYAPAKDIAIFRYTDIIFSAILGFLVFGKIPNFIEIIGYILIVGAAIVILLFRD